MQPYGISELQLWLALVAVAAVAGLLLLFRKPLGHWRQERQVRQALKRLGAMALHNISLPDGVGGEIVIDNLLLATDKILVVDVKRFDGLIFGSSKTDLWTQVINKRSYRFPNPDRHLQLQVSAVRTLLPGVNVAGLHLFTHNAKFPKGRPSSVLQIEDIRKLPRRPRPRDIPKDLRAAWKELRSALE